MVGNVDEVIAKGKEDGGGPKGNERRTFELEILTPEHRF